MLVRHTATGAWQHDGCVAGSWLSLSLILCPGDRASARIGMQLGGTRVITLAGWIEFGTLLGPEETPGWCCSLAGLLLAWTSNAL